MESSLIWNTILTVLLGVIGYIMITKFAELDRLSILLNKTREEIARDHITRAEFRADMKQLFERFDSIEKKLDGMRNRRRSDQEDD
jgi:hypothetical protein